MQTTHYAMFVSEQQMLAHKIPLTSDRRLGYVCLELRIERVNGGVCTMETALRGTVDGN